MSDSIYVVTTGFRYTRSDGRNVLLPAGTYHKDAPQLAGVPKAALDKHLKPFKPDYPAAKRVEPVVEQATAVPGEKRKTSRKKVTNES